MTTMPIPGALLLVGLISGAASAESIAGRYSFGFYGGGADADFAELNNFFSFHNRYAGITENRLQEYGEFSTGQSFSADVRYGFTDNIAFGLSLEFNEFSTSVQQDWPALEGSDIIVIDLDRTIRVRTVPIVVSAYFYQPIVADLSAYGGAGIGIFGTELRSESLHSFDDETRIHQGTIEFQQDPFQSGNRSWSGSEVGYKLTLGGEYSLTSHLVIAGEAAYRQVTVPEVVNALDDEFESYEVFEGEDRDIPFGSYTYAISQSDTRTLAPTSDAVAIELSGTTLNLGLRVYF